MELILTLGIFVLSIAIGVGVLSFLTKRYGTRRFQNMLIAGTISSAFFIVGIWMAGF